MTARTKRSVKKNPKKKIRRVARVTAPAHRHDHDGHAHSHPHGEGHHHDHGHAHGDPHDHEHAHTPSVGYHQDHGVGQRSTHAPRGERTSAARAAQVLEAEAHREPLAPGAGLGKTLFFDAASGIAGDMTIAALVDLGVPFEVVTNAVTALGLSGVALGLSRAAAGAIGATRFEVDVLGRQTERHYREIDQLISKAKLPTAVKSAARAIFRKLAEAESEVHRISIDEVHFHEVGAVDAIVDIVGAAACIVYIGADVVCSPLPLGRGFVDSRHGVLPLPAPAAVACLKGVPTYDAGIEAELVTPTGAAIIATVARRFAAWPSFAPSRIGWGAGTMRLPDRPNAVRAVLGTPTTNGAAERESRASHVVVEANVDDMTGELAAHAISALLGAGALDAWATPITMKKGRPALLLSALAREADAPRIAEAMLRETTSIGVRWTPVRRLERPREIRTVTTRFGDIPVKVSGGPYGEPVTKPEFDACARAAERAGVSVRLVLAEATRAALSIGSV